MCTEKKETTDETKNIFLHKRGDLQVEEFKFFLKGK